MKYIITGSSSGLGFELARKLLYQGDSVIGISRTIGKTKLICEHDNFKWIEFDLSSDTDRLSNLVSFDLLPILKNSEYTLIINAAQFYINSEIYDVSKSLSLFKTNVLSAIALVEQLITPDLRRVLFINSISGLVGNEFQRDYAATKHALKGYSSSLTRYAKNLHFDVMSINPGGIQTELWEGLTDSVDTSDFITPENLAEIIVCLLKVKQRVFVDNFVLLPPSDV